MRTQLRKVLAGAAGILLLVVAAGCPQRPSVAPLGTLSDPVWENQEANAERSDFVVHEHEFIDNGEFLNTAGEDHVKQIAARIASGQDAQVLVERTRNFARPDTEYKYRVHTNPEMDMRRREIVVRALAAMKISDADARVVIAPDLAPEYRAGERAASDYGDTLGNQGNRAGGAAGAGGVNGAGDGVVGGFGANTSAGGY
jgi:hypothetical protein